MKKEELDAAIKDIDENARREKNSIYREFCFKNCNFSVGDIVESYCGTFEITTISWGYGGFDKYPEAMLKGVSRLKNGTVGKREKTLSCYQSRATLVRKAGQA